MKRRNQSWLMGLGEIAACAVLLLCVRVAPAQDAGATDAAVAAKLRVVHTRHYEIHTDLDNALVEELSERMDVMYDQYVAAMSEFRPAENAPALPVYLFDQRARYMAFTHYVGRN